MPNRPNADRRAEFTRKFGVDPIEAGLTGKLADNECRHGNLPSDTKIGCACFPKPVKP